MISVGAIRGMLTGLGCGEKLEVDSVVGEESGLHSLTPIPSAAKNLDVTFGR